MLTLLICSAGFFALFGVVYPIMGVIVLRVMGDHRPLRDLLHDL